MNTVKKILKNQFFILALIILLGLLLRLINLGTEPYWGDEVLGIEIVKYYQNDVAGLIDYIALIETQPPLYYIMLNWWSQCFGYQEFGIRLLSLIFGLGTIVLTYFLGTKLFQNKKIGLLSAFLIALLPIQIEYSQEARPYIIFTFFAILSTLSYLYYKKDDQKVALFFYFVSTLIGLYLHYSYLFFAASLASFWLFDIIKEKDRKKRSKKLIIWLSLHGTILLSYTNQLQIALSRFMLSDYSIWNTERTVSTNRSLSFFGSTFNQIIWLTKTQILSKIEVLTIFIFKISLITSLVWLVIKKYNTIKEKILKFHWQLFFLGWLSIIQVILFFFSPYGIFYTYIYSRHVITGSIFLIIILIFFLVQLNRKKLLLILSLFLLSILNLVILIINNDSVWDWDHRLKMAADHINQSYKPGDIVIIKISSIRTNFNHFLKEKIKSFGLYPLNLIDYHFDYPATRQTLGIYEYESAIRNYWCHNYFEKMDTKMKYLINKYGAKRLWLIAINKNNDVEKWLVDNNWRKAMNSLGHLHRVQLYSKQ